MSSFSLLRTSPLLTSNVKIVVDTSYNLYLESFDSVDLLSNDKYKNFMFKETDTFDNILPVFYKNTSSETIFSVKYDDDNDLVHDDFSKQFDDIYMHGCSTIDDNDNYVEEFECLAPLHIDINNMPTDFFIFRVDGTGLMDLNADNFNDEILANLKSVQNFDLSYKSKLGEWLNNSFIHNENIPASPLEFDVRDEEFTKWIGINIHSGGYSEKSLFIKDILDRESSFFEFDKLMTSNYKNNNLVYPYILNFKFLFNDTPATPATLRKWSMNRYYGFYIDKKVESLVVSAYSPSKLYDDVVIGTNNILYSQNNDIPFVDKFIYNKTYIEYLGYFYEVSEIQPNVFKIITTFNLTGKESLLNTQIINITDDNYIEYNKLYNNNKFEISNFTSADVWVININGKFHNVVLDSNGYRIHSDYAFNINNNVLSYWINIADPLYTTTVNLNDISYDNPPMIFKIYKLSFSDIKDFDVNIVNTKWANIEYELAEQLTETQEPKLYAKNLQSGTTPIDFDNFVINNELVDVPCTSEYVATQEIFSLINFNNENIPDDLSDIWRKSPVFNKWGYKNSLSNGDYMYRLNNSFFGEQYNRSTNVFSDLPNRSERNLDHFYTINPDDNIYVDYSLHVTANLNNDNKSIDKDFKFDVSLYFNYGEVNGITYNNDYFKYLFTKKEYLNKGNIVRNTNKYSTFNLGDDAVTNQTLFMGLRFSIYNVGKVITTSDLFGNTNIGNISLNTTNDFIDYDLSILLSDNLYDISDINFNSNNYETTLITNDISWYILNEWSNESKYIIGDVIVYLDILYENISGYNEYESSKNPGVDIVNWKLYDTSVNSSPFWSPILAFGEAEWVYNYNEFWVRNDIEIGTDFWIPNNEYNIDDIVLFNNKYYTCIVNQNTTIPTSSSWSITVDLDNVVRLWDKISIWKSTSIYDKDKFVVYDDTLYKNLITSNINSNPVISNTWLSVYKFTQDTDYVYGTDRESNSIIYMNGTYYMCTNNNNSTLDNGIVIYINKKWKNILINYSINDNTYADKLSNVNRDDLYTGVFSKLTARNLVDSLSYIDDKNGFSEYIKYVFIEDDLSYKIYDINNIKELPYMILADEPDGYITYIDSLNQIPLTVSSNLFKPVAYLNDDEIKTISEINNFNFKNLAVGYLDINIKDDININTKRKMDNIDMYRFNGDYTPIFNDIHLFKAPTLSDTDNLYTNGNYKFDTELTEFGILNERVISKVNLVDTVLKFSNSNNINSIYPMLDEFGYTTIKQFIFKSQWDYKFYTKTY